MPASINPMLLQHALRGLCTDSSQWVYAVFWRILPRNYPPPQWDTEGGVMDRSKSNKRNWILVWEDGFCDFAACGGAGSAQLAVSSSFLSTRQLRPHVEPEPDTMSPELFFKMSHEVYNYGEGLMGKVAVDNSHRWVFKEPLENEMSFHSPWHASLDPHPRTWEAQFKAGIQTIAVVAVQEGVLQLGSTKRMMEDLSFVLYMQRKFNFLHTSSTSSGSSSCGTKRPLPPTFDSHSQPATSCTMTAHDPWRPTLSNIADIPSFPGLMKRAPAAAKLAYLDSPSPPDALLPSAMSSLHALLSKLPSVTDTESAIHGHGANPTPMISHPMAEVKVMPDSGSTSEAGTVEHPSHHHHHEMGSTFLEFLNESGISEALENGDSSYTSFLNEICS